MPWELVERLSWLAGIVSALLAAVAAWSAARTARGSARDLALVIAAATDRPELLAVLEADALARVERVRRRVRAALALISCALLLVGLGGAIAWSGLSMGRHEDLSVVGGHRPRAERECAAAGEATVCADSHVYLLGAAEEVETRFAGPERDGAGVVVVTLPRCRAEVRWRVSVDGQVVASAVSHDVHVGVEFRARAGRQHVFTAERAPGGECETVRLDVRLGVTHDR
ncbi:hypothetical protein [Actinosynnema mirum]|uniref:Uncharacterized protein n=1 Tax=Actinosynnema mirum (strain ATCC 29888 / DSM 43827 / JCM 3225 / NBRC 14064 / NCIMB 13271 / NRRL B-12336 / IMRU 3971 / 101) TaxID=446462 RepID=C6WKA7_ACTMD|nr:hypothetical protein [Actinosynnema mirum]ACU38320.1 hypothetical protein Amir_4474 [Actinosynnema mirum DSM 43827]